MTSQNHQEQKIVIVTACGSKKENSPHPAWRLYTSSRIRYLYKKSKELGYPFYILSAKYGLVHSEDILEPYDEILTEERAKDLVPQVAEVLRNFEIVVYYRGGARTMYLYLIKEASKIAGTRLVSFGYANMGDINKLEAIIQELKGGDLVKRLYYIPQVSQD